MWVVYTLASVIAGHVTFSQPCISGHLTKLPITYLNSNSLILKQFYLNIFIVIFILHCILCNCFYMTLEFAQF